MTKTNMPSEVICGSTGQGYVSEKRITGKGQVQYLISLGNTNDYRYIIREVEGGELEINERVGLGYLLLAAASPGCWTAAFMFCVAFDNGEYCPDDYPEIELLRGSIGKGDRNA